MSLPDYHPFKSNKAKDRYLSSNTKRAKDWPVPSETKIVDTEYGQTFVRISGPKDGVPLVLLHGLSVSSLMWTCNVEELSKQYRTYAIDTIDDWGLSVYTKKPKNRADYTNWLNESFNALGLKNNINIAGVSFGGWLTLQYALSFPDRLNKIVLIAPTWLVRQSPLFMLRMPMALGGSYLSKKAWHWLFKDSFEI